MPITRRSLLLSPGALMLAAAQPPPLPVMCPLTAEPDALIPGISTSPAARLLGGKLYRGLYRTGADGTPQPDLAAATTTDGATVTLRLLPGATWHDGGAVTSDDVVFSLDRFHRRLQPALDWGWLAQIRAPDPMTVELTLATPTPFAARLDALSLPIVPQHVHDTLDLSVNPRQTPPIGCGPFRLAEWLRLTPFEWYAGPKPPAIDLVCPVLPSAAVCTALALAGNPVLLAGSAVDLAALPRLRADPRLAAEAEPPLLPLLAGVRLNPAVPALARPDVQSALYRALDPAAAAHQAWFGAAQPVAGPGFDPHAASAALTQAGLRPDDDGIRLRLTHLAAPDAPWPQLAALVRLAWAAIGVEVTVELASHAAIQRRIAAGDYQCTGFAAATAPDNALPLVNPACPVVHDKRLHWHGTVFGSFADATLA